jgi:hypothetical protein
MNETYINQLERVIKQMLVPIKGIPFKLVIESITETKLLPFEFDNPDDKALLDDLIIVAKISGEAINKFGILSRRPNEVGNKIEPFVKDSLNKLGLTAFVPESKSGKARSTGYPDICFRDKANRFNYLECKSYAIDSLNSSLRTFYLSPSKDTKIIHDAHHFAISYEIIETNKISDSNLYKCTGWKLLTLENLLVDVKFEFNSDNIRLYDNDSILAKDVFQM